MDKNNEKIVGIIGGMGPEATVDLMRRIIKNTSALDDADHIRCIVDNNPKIPSRMRAILENSNEKPDAEMADMGKRLEAWGADFLAIPCNTAHYYHASVAKAVTIPVLNMIELTVNQAMKKYPGLQRVGIMATPMVRITGLYESAFAEHGVQVIYPGKDTEDTLFATIKAIKAGHTTEQQEQTLRSIRTSLLEKNASACILACTELGVLLKENATTIDAAEVLACTIVKIAKNCRHST